MRLLKISMKRLLVPLLAALALPNAVISNNTTKEDQKLNLFTTKNGTPNY